MEITHDVTIDLLRPRQNVIRVVQEDSTRTIRLKLLSNNQNYNVANDLDEGETLLKFVEFRKADGHGGMYDTTSTGETAVELEDSDVPNVWLVNLDGQCFTAPGWTQINVRFETEDGKRIHTFRIMVDVEPTASSDTESTDWGELNSIADLRNAVSAMFEETMSVEAKQALLNLLAHVAYVDEHGQDYYDELEAELFRTAEIVSISAVFDQGSAVIYDTDNLDTLRQYLTVTAAYEDMSTREVTGYTLSGTLTVGTSTITVSYGGKTATFTVAVSLGLDSICFGTKTYRDIFITDNLVSWFGNFEDNFVVQSDYIYKDTDHTSGYHCTTTVLPSVSSSVYNSPNHSLQCPGAGTGGYVSAYSTGQFGVDYIVGFACNISAISAGKLEFQAFGASSTVVRANRSTVTDGWEPVVAIGQFVDSSSHLINMNFGSLQSPQLTGYMDDLVLTPCPSGMTLEQATTAMRNFMEMVARGDS